MTFAEDRLEEVEREFFDIYIHSLEHGYKIESIYMDSETWMWFSDSDLFEEDWSEIYERVGDEYDLRGKVGDIAVFVAKSLQDEMGVKEYVNVCPRCSADPLHASDGSLYCPLCGEDVEEVQPLSCSRYYNDGIETPHRVFGVTFAGVKDSKFADTRPFVHEEGLAMMVASCTPFFGIIVSLPIALLSLYDRNDNRYGLEESAWRNLFYTLPFYLMFTWVTVQLF